MRILWDNEIDKYTPLYSSQKSNFPATNAKHIHLSSPWRTTGVEDQYYTVDAGSGKTITADCAVIIGKTPTYKHNLTSGATAKIQAHPTNTWTAPDLDQAFTWNADSMIVFFTQTTKRFWRFYFDDASNPDGYLNIPRLALGKFLQMPDVEPNFDLPKASSSRKSVSPSGQGYGDQGILYLAPAFSFPLLTQDEHEALDEMWIGVENIKPVVLVIWENSLDVQGSIYCWIDQDRLDLKKLDSHGLYWSLQINFLEAF